MSADRRSAALRWAAEGTDLFLSAVAGLGDDDLSGPVDLPGWTGKHLLAHVAANADALHNLVEWARTGVETPMYRSDRQRDADIAAGARLPATELRRWSRTSAARLAAALATLGEDQWASPVRTAQARWVTAEEIPWLRAREVMVHAVDVGSGPAWRDLPVDFLHALLDDVVSRRSDGAQPSLLLTATDTGHTWTVSGRGATHEVLGSVAGLAAYLTGRPDGEVTSPHGQVPVLPRWL